MKKKLGFSQIIDVEPNRKKNKKNVKTVNFDHLDGIVTWCFVCKKSVFLKQLLDSQVFWTIWVSTVQCGFSEMCVFYGLKRPLSKGTLIKVAKKRKIDKIGAFLRISLQAISREHQKKVVFLQKCVTFFYKEQLRF